MKGRGFKSCLTIEDQVDIDGHKYWYFAHSKRPRKIIACKGEKATCVKKDSYYFYLLEVLVRPIKGSGKLIARGLIFGSRRKHCKNLDVQAWNSE